LGRRAKTPAHAAITARRELPWLHVPEDRQPDQQHRDDPQNYVFALVFLFRHGKQYTTPEIAVQVQL
jgi:hypothetical protein